MKWIKIMAIVVFSWFCGSGILEGLSWAVLGGGSHAGTVRCRLRMPSADASVIWAALDKIAPSHGWHLVPAVVWQLCWSWWLHPAWQNQGSWWLASSRTRVAGEPGRHYMAFLHLNLEIRKHHFHCLLLVISESISPAQIKREGMEIPALHGRIVQKIGSMLSNGHNIYKALRILPGAQ